MYLSFLEVTHNGGLSADQAKNVQFVSFLIFYVSVSLYVCIAFFNLIFTDT